MIRVLYALICLIAFSVQAAAPVIPAFASIASRTSSCIAPCYVYFDATGTTDTDISGTELYALDYRWNFGDSAAGTWANGANTALSKNQASGPAAAHVYETESTFTVTLQVSDGTGNVVTRTGTVIVTAADSATEFATTKTVCVNNIGDAVFTSCPSGATQNNTNSWTTAIGYITGTVRRILFKRGGTWTVATSPVLLANGPGLIGAYGSGALPIIRSTANVGSLTLSDKTTPGIGDWRIMDLEFDGNSQGTGTTIFSGEAQINQVLFLRVAMHHMTNGIDLGPDTLEYWNTHGFPGNTLYDQIAVVDSYIHDSEDNDPATGHGGCGGFIAAKRFAWMGNNVYNMEATEHNLRTPILIGGVISNNTMDRPDVGHQTLTLRGPLAAGNTVYAAGTYTENVVISDNYLGSGIANLPFTIAPTNPGQNELIRKIIFERNFIVGGTATSEFFLVEAVNLTLRNNIFYQPGNSEVQGIALVVAYKSSVGGPVTSDVRILNNTFYNTVTKNNFVAVYSDEAQPTNVMIKNNLAYAPNDSNHQMIGGTVSTFVGLVQSNNSADADIGGAAKQNPGFDGPLSSASGFRPGTSGYGVNGGADVFPASFDDFFHCDNYITPRHKRMGAFEPRTEASCRGVAGP